MLQRWNDPAATMDFASLMSAQIAKSKSPPATSSSNSQQSKYLKRSELESARQAAYAAEKAKIEAEREERLAKKRKLEDDEAEKARVREEKKRKLAEESRIKREEEEARQERLRRKRLGLPEQPDKKDDVDSKEGTPMGDLESRDIAEEELLVKLRGLSEPAKLFGESHKARLKRYLKLVERSQSPQVVLSDGPIPTTLKHVHEAEMRVPAKLPAKGTPERDLLFRQLASYFTMLLIEWERALARREASVKDSYQGKQAYNAMVQSRENMKPLFRKFEKGDVEEGVLEPVLDIVKCAQERRYVDANDGYLRLSIGKA